MPYNLINQTNTITKQLFAISPNENFSMEITSERISLGAGLIGHNPVHGIISQNDISTNINTETDFKIIADANIRLESQSDMYYTSAAGGINLQAQTDMNFTSDAGGLVATMNYFQLIARNQYINLESQNNITLTSNGGSVNLEAPTGKIYANSDIIVADATEPTWITTLETSGLLFNLGSVGNSVSIDAEGGASINLSSAVGTANLSPSILSLNDTIDTASLSVVGGNLNIVSTGITLSGNDFINIIANNDNMSFTADDDIKLTSVGKGILLNGGSGDAGQPDITLTTQSGTLTGNITLLSAGSIDMNAQNSSMTLNALNDITVQSNGLGTMNLNTPNMNSYNYALPISLNHFEKGTWSYTLGSQVFEDVFSSSPITISLPSQFFAENPISGYTSTRWQINFDMNCWNFSDAGDKGFATYVSFIDNNANIYEPFLYNQLTPFCKWDNPPTFSGAYSNFKSINFCDYVDFRGLVGSNDSNIRLQMNIAGNNSFNNVDFKFKIGFTRIQRI